METKTCVLIADIDEDFRRLLGDVLSQEDDMECVGNTDNGVEALTLAAERQPDDVRIIGDAVSVGLVGPAVRAGYLTARQI